MATNETNPVALTPNTRSDRDFWIQLNAHLEIALKVGFWNRIRASRRGIALKSVDHSIKVSLLRSFDWCWYRSTVDSFMEDWVVGVVFLHSSKVIRAFEQMRTLTRGIFRTNRLTVDALRRQTLNT